VDRPIYFIGGTFGGTSSGWWIAALTATLTAVGAFVAGWRIEDYKRHRDRQALAAALRSEITVTLQLIRIAEASFRQTLAEMQDGRVSGLTEDILSFPTTVYEKCVDRVGTLGESEADGVIQFYNFLNGVRFAERLAFRADAPLDGRITSLNRLILIASETELSQWTELPDRLRALANRPWRFWLWRPFS
jgi:hypothetical protein